MFFDSTAALPLIYKDKRIVGRLDLEQERAMLAKAQRKKVEMANLLEQKKFVYVDEVTDEWARLILADRSKLLSLPTKLAAHLAAEPNPNVCHAILEDRLHEALHELADGHKAGCQQRIAAEKDCGLCDTCTG